jgi:hypothetical protein
MRILKLFSPTCQSSCYVLAFGKSGMWDLTLKKMIKSTSVLKYSDTSVGVAPEEQCDSQ